MFDPRYKLGWLPMSGLNESVVRAALKEEVKRRHQQNLSNSYF